MPQKMTWSSCRPLKCTLCCRRFKYDACMNAHIRKDHYQLLIWLTQQRAARRYNDVQKQFDAKITTSTTTPKPIRVSVIKQNFLPLKSNIRCIL